MKSTVGLLLGFGICSFAPLLRAEEKAESERVEPWIGIVEVARGEKLDLTKLKDLSTQSKFDWGNIIAFKILDNRAVFVVDASGPAAPIAPPLDPFERKLFEGRVATRIPPVAHFQLLLREYGHSIQTLNYVSDFESLPTKGFEVSRTSLADQEPDTDKPVGKSLPRE